MMNQIPGFGIVVIFVVALGMIVLNETVVSSVSVLLTAVTSQDFVAVSQETPLEGEEVRPLDYHLSKTSIKPKVPKCLVNVHIPKVGGRTVGTFLQQVGNATGFERYPLYGHKGEHVWEDVVSAKRTLQSEDGAAVHNNHDDSNVSPDDRDNGIGSITEQKDYNQNIFVQGHFTARIFDLYPELKECLVMTVLRQPVDRAISAFFFHNHQRSEIDKCLWPENYNTSDEAETNTTVETNQRVEEEASPGVIIELGNSTSLLPTTMADHQGAKMKLSWARIRRNRQAGGYGKGRCKLFWQYSNDMTLRFAGLPELPWKSWEMNGSRRRGDSLHREFAQARFNVSSIPRMNEKHLERAKENMKNTLGLVCFLHDLPSCAERILEAFQLDASELDLSTMSTNKTTRYRTKSRPDEMEDEEVQKFQEANRLDQELYDWALETYS